MVNSTLHDMQLVYDGLLSSLNHMQSTGLTYIERPRIQAKVKATGHSVLVDYSDEKKKKLEVLKEKTIGDCRRCGLCNDRTNIVFGEGNVQAKLVFVGEAPGAEEDKQGRPFVGRAGKLLDKMIEAMGLTREDVYICNVVKCRPPENRDPTPEEIAACEPFLKAQLEIIKPTVIVALGRHACQTLLRTETPISMLRGKWTSYEGIALMPTFHPAYLLRNPTKKREAWEDLQHVMGKLGLKNTKQEIST